MTATTSGRRYSAVDTDFAGTTGTGLDQIVQYIFVDPGLAGANEAPDIVAGAQAANAMNLLIVEAANATGAADDGRFTADEVRQMNAYIRANHLDSWTFHHGDDADGVETGFHRVQNDGGTLKFQGNALINTVADGLYHLGFEVQGDTFLNEDGAANATVQQVAKWLTDLYTDHSTTGTGLDYMVDAIIADAGLARRVSASDRFDGADAANGMNQIIADAIAALGLDADNKIDAADIVALNGHIRADAAFSQSWIGLHGDDENGIETGFHKVQNDGATTILFGQNFVDTVADGVYHLGFEIQGGNFLNEDGDANATVCDVASWVDFFYSDVSTTGTGLDRLVDTMHVDPGLLRCTTAADIMGGLRAANFMNQMIADAIGATGVAADGWITSEDVRALNAWLRSDADKIAAWTCLHGDDEDGSETGFHLIQNDGSTTAFFGRNLVNTVADGIYHLGFQIQGERLLNEDGAANASVSDVSSWLNYFYGGATLVEGTGDPEALAGTDIAEHISARGGDDCVAAGGGDDLVYAGGGNDHVSGGEGDDLIYGNAGNDCLDGNEGSDSYRYTGSKSAGFEGWDSVVDTGALGTDAIAAFGGNVDIGVTGFGAGNGIEVVDATGATGMVRLLGDLNANHLDFSAVSFLGAPGQIQVAAGSGNDCILGTLGNDWLLGDSGNDWIDGNAGDDLLAGGSGADRFRFGAAWGDDVVTDFRLRSDKLDFSDSGAAGMASLTIEAVQNGTLISFGADSALLIGVYSGALTAGDFVF